MIEHLRKNNADFCVGTREKMRSSWRAFLNRFGRAWLGFALELKIDDPFSGAIVGKAKAFKQLNLTSKEFEIELEFMLEIAKHGFKIVEYKIRTPKISKSRLKLHHALKINNFFDIWCLRNLKILKISKPKKVVLLFACAIGLFLGKMLLVLIGFF